MLFNKLPQRGFNKRIQAATQALRKEQRNLVVARESLKQEVAERKESEQAALESERKYRPLAENIRDVIWTMDIDLKFTYVIPAVTQMLEWTAAEFLDLTLEQIMLARRSVSVSDVLNLNDVVKEYLVSPEFNRLKSYHPLVEVDTRLAPDLSHTLGSPLHLFKSLMNLVSNAAESMPDGGKLTISTEKCHFDRPILGYTKIPEGDYTLLKISDTGVGISADDINRIFEPFYTKKKMGRSGTGLGMAVVWGTVEDHQAFIDIESTNGGGTIISIYLPVTDRVIAAAPVPRALEEHRGAGESVLVVDDVKEQREFATGILEQLGYLFG